MIRIKKLDWISEDAKEAELIISDGINECIVFCQPCNYSKGHNVIEPLHLLDTFDLCASSETNTYIENIGGFKHHLIAQVVDSSIMLARVGGIYLYLNTDRPVWCEDGMFIELNTGRIDLW